MLTSGIQTRLEELQRQSRRVLLLAEDHADLLSLEWAAEKRRLLGMVSSQAVSAIAGILALAFLAVAILVTFWDSPHRTAVAWILPVTFAGLAVIGWYRSRRLALAGRDAFSHSRREWSRTWSSLKETL